MLRPGGITPQSLGNSKPIGERFFNVPRRVQYVEIAQTDETDDRNSTEERARMCVDFCLVCVERRNVAVVAQDGDRICWHFRARRQPKIAKTDDTHTHTDAYRCMYANCFDILCALLATELLVNFVGCPLSDTNRSVGVLFLVR